MWRAVWACRGFVLGSVRREFESRYRASLLGAAWAVLQPLAMILVYTLVFSQVMRARLPGAEGAFAYSIHLCAGVLTWGLFAQIEVQCGDYLGEDDIVCFEDKYGRVLPVAKADVATYS